MPQARTLSRLSAGAVLCFLTVYPTGAEGERKGSRSLSEAPGRKMNSETSLNHQGNGRQHHTFVLVREGWGGEGGERESASERK